MKTDREYTSSIRIRIWRRFVRLPAETTSPFVPRVTSDGWLARTLFSALIVPFVLAELTASQAPDHSLHDFLAQASELERRQDYAGAEKVYQRALSAYPNQPEVLKRLGIIYQTELKFPESIEVFQKSLQVAPQYPEVNFYLGLSYFGLNQYEKAVECFTAELKLQPDYRRAHYYAGKALLALGRKGEAIEHFETLVKENPSDAKVWYELARLYRTMAVHAYNRVAVIDPDSVLLDALKAEAYAEDRKFPEAILEYAEVLKKQPDFPGVHSALGEIYFKMNEPAEAERELRLALEDDPNNPPVNYTLGQMLRATTTRMRAMLSAQVTVPSKHGNFRSWPMAEIHGRSSGRGPISWSERIG